MIDLLFDWFVANQMVFWLLIALLCLLFEMGSPGLFFFLSFFFGALAGVSVTFFTKSWMWQSIFFVIGTSIAFLLLHYWVRKHSKVFDTHTQTNVYAMRSKRGKVMRQITKDKMGLVKIGGETWSARSLKGIAIEEGTEVTVVRIKGAHLVVEQTKEVKE